MAKDYAADQSDWFQSYMMVDPDSGRPFADQDTARNAWDQKFKDYYGKNQAVVDTLAKSFQHAAGADSGYASGAQASGDADHMTNWQRQVINGMMKAGGPPKNASKGQFEAWLRNLGKNAGMKQAGSAGEDFAAKQLDDLYGSYTRGELPGLSGSDATTTGPNTGGDPAARLKAYYDAINDPRTQSQLEGMAANNARRQSAARGIQGGLSDAGVAYQTANAGRQYQQGVNSQALQYMNMDQNNQLGVASLQAGIDRFNETSLMQASQERAANQAQMYAALGSSIGGIAGNAAGAFSGNAEIGKGWAGYGAALGGGISQWTSQTYTPHVGSISGTHRGSGGNNNGNV